MRTLRSKQVVLQVIMDAYPSHITRPEVLDAVYSNPEIRWAESTIDAALHYWIKQGRVERLRWGEYRLNR